MVTAPACSAQPIFRPPRRGPAPPAGARSRKARPARLSCPARLASPSSPGHNDMGAALMLLGRHGCGTHAARRAGRSGELP
jgi:hypothetical protein